MRVVFQSVCVNLALLLLFIPFYRAGAQELDMNVTVIGPNTASSSDKSVFPQMEKAIKEFANNTKWTNDVFEPNEKIRCNFQLSVRRDFGNNSFSCDLFIEASRPVYGSSYETNLMIINEKEIPINFDPFKPLENSKEIYFDNLSAVVTFYAYFILAMDYDSFSLEGGDPYVLTLQNMVNSMPAGAKSFDESWSANSKKKNSRFFLMENLTNPRMRSFRRAMYEYHRLYMDNFYKDAADSRAKMLNTIEAIANTDQSYPNSFLLLCFVAAKRNEIVEIYKSGTDFEKNKVITAMSSIDPANTTLYNSIKS